MPLIDNKSNINKKNDLSPFQTSKIPLINGLRNKSFHIANDLSLLPLTNDSIQCSDNCGTRCLKSKNNDLNEINTKVCLSTLRYPSKLNGILDNKLITSKNVSRNSHMNNPKIGHINDKVVISPLYIKSKIPSLTPKTTFNHVKTNNQTTLSLNLYSQSVSRIITFNKDTKDKHKNVTPFNIETSKSLPKTRKNYLHSNKIDLSNTHASSKAKGATHNVNDNHYKLLPSPSKCKSSQISSINYTVSSTPKKKLTSSLNSQIINSSLKQEGSLSSNNISLNISSNLFRNCDDDISDLNGSIYLTSSMPSSREELDDNNNDVSSFETSFPSFSIDPSNSFKGKGLKSNSPTLLKPISTSTNELPHMTAFINNKESQFFLDDLSFSNITSTIDEQEIDGDEETDIEKSIKEMQDMMLKLNHENEDDIRLYNIKNEDLLPRTTSQLSFKISHPKNYETSIAHCSITNNKKYSTKKGPSLPHNNENTLFKNMDDYIPILEKSIANRINGVTKCDRQLLPNMGVIVIKDLDFAETLKELAEIKLNLFALKLELEQNQLSNLPIIDSDRFENSLNLDSFMSANWPLTPSLFDSGVDGENLPNNMTSNLLLDSVNNNSMNSSLNACTQTDLENSLVKDNYTYDSSTYEIRKGSIHRTSINDIHFDSTL